MQLPFFYEYELDALAQQIVLSPETSKHCIQVLRMKTGEQLQLTNGKGLLLTAQIIAEDKKACVVKCINNTAVTNHQSTLSIAISLLKNSSRFEWFLEKATEIGVSEIIPLICHRTERQNFRWERMNGIVISAMLQSRQTFLPTLHQPVFINDAIKNSVFTTKLLAHCEDAKKLAVKNCNISSAIQILIGPEGDFTPNEIALALQHCYQPVTLGNTRLRTETAGMVAATLLMNL